MLVFILKTTTVLQEYYHFTITYIFTCFKNSIDIVPWIYDLIEQIYLFFKLRICNIQCLL